MAALVNIHVRDHFTRGTIHPRSHFQEPVNRLVFRGTKEVVERTSTLGPFSIVPIVLHQKSLASDPMLGRHRPEYFAEQDSRSLYHHEP